MNEELNRALEQISDGHLNEAIQYKKKRFPWLRAIAAVLVLAICWGAFWHEFGAEPSVTEATNPILQNPTPSTGTAPILPTTPISTAPFPTNPFLPTTPITPTIPTPIQPTEPTPIRPTEPTPIIPTEPTPTSPTPITPPTPNPPVLVTLSGLAAEPVYPERPSYKIEQMRDISTGLNGFLTTSIQEFLSGDGNRAYSPVSVYLAMAMLAESSDGESRQQILDLLGVDTIDQLRVQANCVWNAHYLKDDDAKLLLANSLWLDNAGLFNIDTVHRLADDYYASLYAGDLGTEEMNQALREWINSQTGDLLTEQTEELELGPDTLFTLVSTIYFKACWYDNGFSADRTADRVFHSDNGDVTVPFMNSSRSEIYHWGTDYTAVRLRLRGNTNLWLILPDEGKTVEDILESGECLSTILLPGLLKNESNPIVHLSVPKFDISAQNDLIEGMKRLGVTDVFDSNTADLSSLTNIPAYVYKIDHAVRVSVDEEGVAGAAYTMVGGAAGGRPSGEEVDFVLDRPFLFMVTKNGGLPLFTGVVEQP